MFESPTLPPHCSYVERGGASPAATKRSSSGYLTTPDNETSSGTPSTQRLIDGTEGSHGSQNQVPTNTRTSQTNKRKIEHFGPRRKKKELWFCYCLATVQKVVQGTYDIWREGNGLIIRPTMDALGLNSQRGSVGMQRFEEEK